MKKLASTLILLISLGSPVKPQATSEVACTNLPAQSIKDFNIRRVTFTGIPHIRDRVMRRAFSLQEGDIFTFAQLAKGVKNLNFLGLFYKVKKTDVTCEVNQADQWIDFTVYLRELPQHKRRKIKDRKTLYIK